MKYRIQLASNYQVVELEIEASSTENIKARAEVQNAIELVNYLGETVQNDKNPKNAKKPAKKNNTENLATEKQLNMLDKMGISYSEDITRQEAWKLIDKNKS